MQENEKSKSPLMSFHHVGVVVRDIEKADKVLSLLGMETTPMMGSASAKPSPGDVETLHGRVVEAKRHAKGLKSNFGDIGFEVFQPLDGESAWKEFLDNQGEGIHHIGFTTDDLEGDVAKVLEAGGTIVSDMKHNGVMRACYIQIDSLPNIFIELMRAKKTKG